MIARLDLFTRFRSLHDTFFVMAPTWDVLSAISLHRSCFPAIAMSSTAVGYAHGITSEERLPRPALMEALRNICAAVDIPVSFDLEAGQGYSESTLEAVVMAALDAGAVGVNIEDNSEIPGTVLIPADDQARRIEAVRGIAERAGVPLFINARTDRFWIVDHISDEVKASDAIARCNLYLRAGADGAFVSGSKVPIDCIERLASEINGPLSLLFRPDLPNFAELRRSGVRRLNLGSLHARAVMGFMWRVLERLRESEDFSLLNEFALGSGDVNAAVRNARAQFGSKSERVDN